MDKQCAHEEDEEMDEDSENSPLLQLMAKQTHLKDLLLAHHLIGTFYLLSSIHSFYYLTGRFHQNHKVF